MGAVIRICIAAGESQPQTWQCEGRACLENSIVVELCNLNRPGHSWGPTTARWMFRGGARTSNQISDQSQFLFSSSVRHRLKQR